MKAKEKYLAVVYFQMIEIACGKVTTAFRLKPCEMYSGDKVGP